MFDNNNEFFNEINEYFKRNYEVFNEKYEFLYKKITIETRFRVPRVKSPFSCSASYNRYSRVVTILRSHLEHYSTIMTSKQRPPLNNYHYFWFPNVVAIHKFDCIWIISIYHMKFDHICLTSQTLSTHPVMQEWAIFWSAGRLITFLPFGSYFF